MMHIFQYSRDYNFMKVIPNSANGMVRIFKQRGEIRKWNMPDIYVFKRDANPLVNFELILDMDVKDDGYRDI